MRLRFAAFKAPLGRISVPASAMMIEVMRGAIALLGSIHIIPNWPVYVPLLRFSPAGREFLRDKLLACRARFRGRWSVSVIDDEVGDV